MACKYVFLERAEIELKSIVDYLVNEAQAPVYAARFVDALKIKAQLVADNPDMCALSRFPQLATLGYRTAFVDDYLFLYTFDEEYVYIAHIFHQRQNYAKLV